MNRYTVAMGLFFLTCVAFQMQAYEFIVKNFTDAQHDVSLQLKGIGQKPLESQTVEPYGAMPSLFSQVKSKVQGWVNDLQKEWDDKLVQLSTDIDSASAAGTIEKKLSELQDDIDRKIKAGALKVGAKKWVNELNSFKNDVQKGIGKLDKEKLAKNVKKLQAEMDQKLAELSNARVSNDLDTAVFSLPLGDLRAGLCVHKILVDGKSVALYGIAPKEYDALQAIFKRNKNEYIDTVKSNVDAGNYNNLTSALFGICFSRQFDIVDLGDGRLVIITKEKI